MNFSAIRKYDISNGDGIRTSLFVSGCRNNCPGCFNKEAQDFCYGQEYTSEIEQEILADLADPHVSGLSILGGEPFEPENQPAVLDLILKARAQCPQKSIYVWTGYVLEKDLVAGKRKHIDGMTNKILANIDVLVDGPFILEKKNLMLKMRGSSNQRILKKGIDFN